jgi:hypothetical protein
MLFDAVRDECRTNERWTTFQVIRRFYTLAEDMYSRLWIEGSWYDVFKKALEEQEERGLPTFDKPDCYADLCDVAAVLWFYVDPNIKKMTPSLSPRYEVLLPIEALRDVNTLRTTSQDIVRRVVSILACPGVEAPYEEVWKGFFDSYVLLMPTAVCHAHAHSSEICRLHALELEGFLTEQLIKEFGRLQKKSQEA